MRVDQRVFATFALLAISAGILALEPPPGKPPVRNYTMAEYGGSSGQLGWCVRRRTSASWSVVATGC